MCSSRADTYRRIYMRTLPLLTALVIAASAGASAQQLPVPDDGGRDTIRKAAPAVKDSSAKAAAKKVSTTPEIIIRRFRPMDARGLNIFEAPKTDNVPFDGFKFSYGGAFTQ